MATLREQNIKHKGIVKKKQKPRCSITNPFEKFWPLLDSKESELLVNVMKKTICKENGKLKVNWFTLKKLPLDVRKCHIKDLSNKHKLINSDLRAQRLVLKMGINEVSRNIEKNQIACCLIADDVSNSMISKHLLLMTAAKKVPVVILPNMRSVTKLIVGFSSAALGLKIDILNNTESSLHNLYQIVIQLSNKFKNPYHQQIPKKVLQIAENHLELNLDIENYLLKKPREGKAFVPGGITNIKPSNDLSFIPINKMIVNEQEPFEQDEELIENSLSTDLFSIDTKPLCNEDLEVSVKRKTKPFEEPLRYYGLKIKKLKPNNNRKGKKNVNTTN
ncbi:50S ribosomal protein L30e-like,Ribosomal protein L7Ae/L30e/S12e/Gadd45 [Cinara cedri]|uniref:50S ribosomal protein L30e-like,Ribosomal protein L7Ae/L30e/S12e/Gadd45 n=1 Tax=Cinara cedri TaxID=506608 RepID=A0A5E4N3W4_9HEMI|nr:50S ribosomal protein L30e-like,Ribosomal protein L7Ae/L30e/S12e/Gadd45 [Cinara cedri]